MDFSEVPTFALDPATEIGVSERVGGQLDKDLRFRDEKGDQVVLRDILGQGRPVVMAMVYFACPSLCNLQLNGFLEAFRALKWTIGKEFDVVLVSMDPREDPGLAAAKRESYVKAYGRPVSDSAFHFLVGDKVNVSRLAEGLGFRYKWVPETKQFAHVAAAYVLDSEAHITRYLYGTNPDVPTIKMSLLEAGNGRLGNWLERILTYCVRFSPENKKYTLRTWNLLQLGAIFIVPLLAFIWIRSVSPRSGRTEGE